MVQQANPVGVELFSHANSFFCSNKQMVVGWVKTFFQVVFGTWGLYLLLKIQQTPVRDLNNKPVHSALVSEKRLNP